MKIKNVKIAGQLRLPLWVILDDGHMEPMGEITLEVEENDLVFDDGEG